MNPCCTPALNFLFCSATCVFLIHLHAGYHIPQSLEEQARLQRNTLNLSMDSPTSFGDGVEKMMTSTTGTCICIDFDFFVALLISLWLIYFVTWRWSELRKYKFLNDDHRSGNCNLSNCKYPPPQKKNGGASTGFEPMASGLQLQHSSINFELFRPVHKMGADQFVEFILTPERNETWRWCELWKDTFLNKDMIVAVVIAIFRQLQIHPPPPKKKQTNEQI